MNAVEQKWISAVVVLTAVWAGGLVVVYTLRPAPTVSLSDYESNTSNQAAPAPTTRPINLTPPPPAVPVRESLPAVPSPDSTTEQRRARLNAFWQPVRRIGTTSPATGRSTTAE